MQFAGDKVNIFVEGFTRGLHKTSNQFSVRSQCLKATAQCSFWALGFHRVKMSRCLVSALIHRASTKSWTSASASWGSRDLHWTSSVHCKQSTAGSKSGKGGDGDHSDPPTTRSVIVPGTLHTSSPKRFVLRNSDQIHQIFTQALPILHEPRT